MSKDLEGGGCGLFQGTSLALDWRDFKKPLRTLLRATRQRFKPGTFQIQFIQTTTETCSVCLVSLCFKV